MPSPPSSSQRNHCTLFPEGPWSGCCAQHDKDYTDGVLTRRTADALLRECVANRGYRKTAWLMWFGVRMLGWIWYRKP